MCASRNSLGPSCFESDRDVMTPGHVHLTTDRSSWESSWWQSTSMFALLRLHNCNTMWRKIRLDHTMKNKECNFEGLQRHPSETMTNYLLRRQRIYFKAFHSGGGYDPVALPFWNAATMQGNVASSSPNGQLWKQADETRKWFECWQWLFSKGALKDLFSCRTKKNPENRQILKRHVVLHFSLYTH